MYTFKNVHISLMLQTRFVEIDRLRWRSHGQGVAEGIRHSADNRNPRSHGGRRRLLIEITAAREPSTAR